VDLLLVIDDSESMKPDAVSLASKLEGFLRKLETYSMDWQLCMTTTNYNVDNGSSLAIAGNTRRENWILKKGDTNVSGKVIDTIESHPFGSNGSGDERGIASMRAHLMKAGSNHCYRPGAAVSVIVISDEDERSVGGNYDLNDKQYRPIEDVDKPEGYVTLVQQSLKVGASPVAHVVHSIIIQPSDQSCLAEQNVQGYPGYVGTYYHKLSGLTGGSVASICSSDYSNGLSVFAEQIQKSFQRIQLDCQPAAGFQLSTSPSNQNIQAHAEDTFLVIDSQIAQDLMVSVQYMCQ
jgi:hypothetical protein